MKMEEIEKCSICLDDCLNYVLVLPCKHKFHKTCLKSYLENKYPNDSIYVLKCPMCIREYILDKNLDNMIKDSQFNSGINHRLVLYILEIITFMTYAYSLNYIFNHIHLIIPPQFHNNIFLIFILIFSYIIMFIFIMILLAYLCERLRCYAHNCVNGFLFSNNSYTPVEHYANIKDYYQLNSQTDIENPVLITQLTN